MDRGAVLPSCATLLSEDVKGSHNHRESRYMAYSSATRLKLHRLRLTGGGDCRFGVGQRLCDAWWLPDTSVCQQADVYRSLHRAIVAARRKHSVRLDRIPRDAVDRVFVADQDLEQLCRVCLPYIHVRV
jgi:hypothetical protein